MSQLCWRKTKTVSTFIRSTSETSYQDKLWRLKFQSSSLWRSKEVLSILCFQWLTTQLSTNLTSRNLDCSRKWPAFCLKTRIANVRKTWNWALTLESSWGQRTQSSKYLTRTIVRFLSKVKTMWWSRKLRATIETFRRISMSITGLWIWKTRGLSTKDLMSSRDAWPWWHSFCRHLKLSSLKTIA